MRVKFLEKDFCWKPKQLEILFETQEEFTTFIAMVRMDVSVSKTVFYNDGESRSLLKNILNKINVNYQF